MGIAEYLDIDEHKKQVLDSVNLENNIDTI